MRTIAVIGGGFCGTMVTVNLARFAETPLRVVLINACRPTGRGAAYSTTRREHLLNVAARNMSAFPDRPDHFVNWLQWRSEYYGMPIDSLRECFVPRRIYGDYLCSLLFGYYKSVDERAAIAIELLDDEAVDLKPHARGGFIVSLARGGCVDADQVVLATGNQPPAPLPGMDPRFAHPAWVADPWSDWESRRPDPAGDVVLLGTGLTMVDAFLALTAQRWQGRITAISRSGRLPLSHFRGTDYPEFPPESPEALGLERLVRLIEQHCEQLQKQNANPAILVDRLRSHTQRIWKNFSLSEKRQFLRCHAARWNVTRHRIAESIHQCVTQAIQDGRLRIIAGTIHGVEADGPAVRVRFRRDGQPENFLSAALVINCTGPAPRFSQCASPLLQNLLRRGLVRPDELDLGMEIDEEFAAVSREGSVHNRLFALGPLLKGTLWETTAVPELRGQAFQVARNLLAGDQQANPNRFPLVQQDIIEYYI